MPPEIIVAIIGVETFTGATPASYRVLDALATLAFDYPRRAAFFRGELKQFLLLARDQRMLPLVPKGSFAGALGVPQFMPGSYREFAVDFDGDGRIDLWTSAADIVGSVGNYLARHDWQRGQPVLLPAAIAEDSASPARSAASTAASASAAPRTRGRPTASPRRPRRRTSTPIPSALLMLEEKDADGVETRATGSPATTSTC